MCRHRPRVACAYKLHNQFSFANLFERKSNPLTLSWNLGREIHSDWPTGWYYTRLVCICKSYLPPVTRLAGGPPTCDSRSSPLLLCAFSVVDVLKLRNSGISEWVKNGVSVGAPPPSWTTREAVYRAPQTSPSEHDRRPLLNSIIDRCDCRRAILRDTRESSKCLRERLWTELTLSRSGRSRRKPKSLRAHPDTGTRRTWNYKLCPC